MSKYKSTSALSTAPEELLDASGYVEKITAEEIKHESVELEGRFVAIKKQLEEIELKKRAITEIQRKQNELESGRAEVLEKLARGIVLLQEKLREMQREGEMFQTALESYQRQHSTIASINQREWPKDSIDEELTIALAKLDQSKAVYSQYEGRVEALRAQTEPDQGDESSSLQEAYANQGNSWTFTSMLKMGIAFCIPLGVLLFIGLIIASIIFKH